ncbi:MAG: MCP four helix bundle domain-containing protein [Catalinimonas sp.]
MRWHFTARTGRRIIWSFVAVLALLLTVGVIGIGGVNRLSSRFNTLFEDRLEPEIDISLILEKMYQNRLALEELVTQFGIETPSELRADIRRNNLEIDSLIGKYSATLMVPEEVRSLRNYRKEIRTYRELEADIIATYEDDHKAAQQLFTERSFVAFQRAVSPVEKLSVTQATAGRELYEDAERTVQTVKISLYVAMSIAVVIAVVLGILVGYSTLDGI